MPLAILKCEKILKWNILFPAKEWKYSYDFEFELVLNDLTLCWPNLVLTYSLWAKQAMISLNRFSCKIPRKQTLIKLMWVGISGVSAFCRYLGVSFKRRTNRKEDITIHMIDCWKAFCLPRSRQNCFDALLQKRHLLFKCFVKNFKVLFVAECRGIQRMISTESCSSF